MHFLIAIWRIFQLGIYFSGTTLENHTQRNFYGNISKVEEAGIYKEI